MLSIFLPLEFCPSQVTVVLTFVIIIALLYGLCTLNKLSFACLCEVLLSSLSVRDLCPCGGWLWFVFVAE